MTKQRCAVLFVNTGSRSAYPAILREVGFAVHETSRWPAEHPDLRDFHVVVLRLSAIDRAPMLAARIRARRHFGHRLLIALVPPETPLHERRGAQVSGFDDVIADGADGRLLIARILRGLRARPEFRCLLPPPPSRRAVA